ncbi:ComF family protein [Streptomyces griseofuscus]|uniref:ComF family protein n=1 Tax=Streptomycetaceae TaxID=2062 RepID=UPI00068E94B7|nr:phosphoribosyltransferase [Actinacidiphila yeochonensis]
MTDFALPEPLGFPNCRRCAYLINGTPRICGTCAGRTLQPIPESHCLTCSQALAPGRPCANTLCGWREGNDRRTRSISRIDAVAQYSGMFAAYLRIFKETPGQEFLAAIFGRLLVGWMETHPHLVADIDLIVGNPTHPDRKPIQHIEAIMTAAYAEDTASRWPIAPPGDTVLIKTSVTEASKDRGFAGKEQAAWDHVGAVRRNAAYRETIRDARILLVDDVCTTGLQLNYIAGGLLRAGAREVRGLVLARVPWRY